MNVGSSGLPLVLYHETNLNFMTKSDCNCGPVSFVFILIFIFKTVGGPYNLYLKVKIILNSFLNNNFKM